MLRSWIVRYGELAKFLVEFGVGAWVDGSEGGLYAVFEGGWMGGARTASVHLNSPTNNRVSDVVIRRVLLKSDFKNASAAAFESSIFVNGVFEVEVYLFVQAGDFRKAELGR
jgi:hypothetical protein